MTTVASQVAAEPAAMPILDASMATQILFPSVAREGVRRLLKDRARSSSLVRLHKTTVTGEKAPLPAGVEEEFAPSFQVGTSNANLGLFSYIPDYFDFVRETDSILPRFSIMGGDIYVFERGGIPDNTELSVYAAWVPQMPDDDTEEIDASEQLMDEMLLITAQILRGELPLAALGLKPEMMEGKPKKKGS